jgi:phosphoserine phosphatase RsbU/P
MGLLPKQLPRPSGCDIAVRWQPAKAVSGDYYDVISINETMIALCIADVMGHGVPAALLMSNLQAAVRLNIAEEVSPKMLCEKINKFISQNISPGTFITFFYGVLNLKNKSFTYTNAGHNEPILVRNNNGIVSLKDGGFALGVETNERYCENTVQLNEGDSIIIFTDGIVEARNPQGEMYGENRLCNTAIRHKGKSAQELIDTLDGTVQQFSNGFFDDDFTIMVAKIEKDKSEN